MSSSADRIGGALSPVYVASLLVLSACAGRNDSGQDFADQIYLGMTYSEYSRVFSTHYGNDPRTRVIGSYCYGRNRDDLTCGEIESNSNEGFQRWELSLEELQAECQNWSCYPADFVDKMFVDGASTGAIFRAEDAILVPQVGGIHRKLTVVFDPEGILIGAISGGSNQVELPLFERDDP